MNNKAKYSVIFILIMLIFSSCKKKPISVSEDSKIINEFINNDIKFEYFSTKSKLSFSDGKADVSTAVSVKIEKNKQIWVSIMPALGIEMMRAKITQDSVYLLNRFQKTYLATTLSEYSKQIGTEIQYSTIEALVMGDVPLKDITNAKLKKEENRFVLTQEIQSVVIENIISKSSNRLENLNIISDSSSLKSTFSEFTDLDQQQFAQQVDIKLIQPNKSEINVSVKHNKFEKSSSPISFPFNIPPGYEKL